ncbi:hypothetical protein E4T42_01566 [Aureobasidium subglaciale]|nr:hypothetical protein E4T42_01566 [Aureobasidium subglaciale]
MASYTSHIHEAPVYTVTNIHLDLECTSCGETLLHSNEVTIHCKIYPGHYHESRCINCFMMEIDNCCIEITAETASTVESLLLSKLNKDCHEHHQDVDATIYNVLEHALDARLAVYGFNSDGDQIIGSSAQSSTPDHVDQARVNSSSSSTSSHDSEYKIQVSHGMSLCASTSDRTPASINEGRDLNDDLLDFYMVDSDSPAVKRVYWEDLAVDELPDYIDEDQLSDAESEVDIICSDLIDNQPSVSKGLITSFSDDELPDYVDDGLPPPVDTTHVSFEDIINGNWAFEGNDEVQSDRPEWLGWRR